jgi:hypothetical protein
MINQDQALDAAAKIALKMDMMLLAEKVADIRRRRREQDTY